MKGGPHDSFVRVAVINGFSVCLILYESLPASLFSLCLKIHPVPHEFGRGNRLNLMIHHRSWSIGFQ
jgi:hypothetical protein